MSGEWLALGVVGLLAAGGLAKRGGANREVNPRVRRILLRHPNGAEALRYLDDPSLARWRAIRSMIIPGADEFGMRTLWQAVTRYAWYDLTGERQQRPPFEWTQTDPAAYPDTIDAYPPPVVVEKAVLMAVGEPVMVQAAPQQALVGGPRTLEPIDPTQFSGLELTLYPGRLPDGRVYWLSVPPQELGVAAFIEQRSSGFHAVWVLRPGQRRHLLTTEDDLGTTVTGGVGPHEAVAAARRRHDLDLTLDDSQHWSYEGRGLEPGPLPAWRGDDDER